MKPRTLFPIAAAILTASLAACGDDETPTGPGQGDADITGAVAFVKTGGGVPNLVVALLGAGQVVATTHTGPDGTFAFAGVPDGTYTARLTGFDLTGLNLQATAFDPPELGVTVGSAPVDLAFAAVGLVPPRVAGDVTCDGVAVEGARIRVIGGASTDEVVATDVRGRFAATSLTEGTYAVIPLEAPCTLAPALASVTIQKGQAGEVDFAG